MRWIVVLFGVLVGYTNINAQSASDADFNADRKVGFPDFLIFASSFGKSTSDVGVDPRADLNGNGTVDFPDFLAFAQVFGQEVSTVTLETQADKEQYLPLEIALLKVDPSVVLEDTLYKGSLGENEIDIHFIDNETLALNLPDVQPGNYEISVTVDNTVNVATISIGDLPVVEDPDAFLRARVEQTEREISALGISEADQVIFQSWSSHVLSNFTPEEKSRAARFILANQNRFNLLNQAAKTAFLNSEESDDNITEKWKDFSELLVADQIALGILTVAVAGSVATGNLPALAISGYAWVHVAYTARLNRVRALESIYTHFENELRLVEISPLSKQSAQNESGGAKKISFFDQKPQTFNFVTNFRQLNADDLNTDHPSIKKIVSTMGLANSIWDRLQGYLNRLPDWMPIPDGLKSKLPKLENQMDVVIREFRINPKHISLESDDGQNSGVTLRSTVSDEGFVIIATLPSGETETKEAIFGLVYEFEGISKSITKFHAVVKPPNVLKEISQVTLLNQSHVTDLVEEIKDSSVKIGQLSVREAVSSLSGLENIQEIGSLSVYNTENLKTLSFLQDAQVTGSVFISNNKSLVDAFINAKQLKEIKIEKNPSLTQVTFANLDSLVSSSRGSNLYIEENSKLSQISFPKLNYVNKGIWLVGNPAIFSVVFPELDRVDGNLTVWGFSLIQIHQSRSNYITSARESNLTSVSFPNLTRTNDLYVSGIKITSFNIPALNEVETFAFDGTGHFSFSFNCNGGSLSIGDGGSSREWAGSELKSVVLSGNISASTVGITSTTLESITISGPCTNQSVSISNSPALEEVNLNLVKVDRLEIENNGCLQRLQLGIPQVDYFYMGFNRVWDVEANINKGFGDDRVNAIAKSLGFPDYNSKSNDPMDAVEFARRRAAWLASQGN